MLAMIKNLFQRSKSVEVKSEISDLLPRPGELGVRILREIELSNELNRVLSWSLSGGYRMECCFLIDGTVKFILYYRGSLLKDVVWAKIDSEGRRTDEISPDIVVWDWVDRYY